MVQALGLKRRVTQFCLLQQEFSNLVITPLLGPQLGNRCRKRITLVLLGCIAGDDLTVGQALNPLADLPPLIQLVVAPVLVDIGQDLVVQHDRPLLVVAGGKKLNHLPPVLLLAFSKLFSFFEFIEMALLDFRASFEEFLPIEVQTFDGET